jgi:hypothetical protein
MQPRSSKLLDFGMWWLTHHRERAMWWYNRALMPLGVRLQKKLALAPGMIDASMVDEILLVCRKQGAPPAALLHRMERLARGPQERVPFPGRGSRYRRNCA